MAHLTDLRPSISTLSEEDALALVLKTRASRRVSKKIVPEKTEKQARAKQQKAPKKKGPIDIDSLSPDMIDTLLKLLEGA